VGRAKSRAALTNRSDCLAPPSQRARHLSLHDALTGLPNRRLMQDRLAQSLAQARREGWSVAVVFIDLDRFKDLNDHHGHAAGDDALVAVVGTLRASLRVTDALGRWGGDELLVVAPATSLAEALQSQHRGGSYPRRSLGGAAGPC
jgi:diguanylate cyclase (GGDEF)-like protein